MEQIETKLNTIGKAIAIIEIIQQTNRPMSIKEIAENLDMNKSSIHHHMKTLTEFGYLQKDGESRKYDIGLGLVRAGQSYLQRLDVRERGHYFLEQLSRKLSETVHMLVLDHNEVVYVDKVDVNHQPGALTCSSFIGHRTDVYSTAAGKVLMAHLERGDLREILRSVKMRSITEYTITDCDRYLEELVKVKQQGYSLDLQEHALGLQCIAVPVMNLHSQCVAAISVSCPVSIISREDLEDEILKQLKETGLQISRTMGYIPEQRNKGTN
ncbi:IclR family transcriptional regulator [Oceanispirochaeta crateris]|uniref:IclR family transcriptional regulator n=1 Tax=Oceanispirochaeta crateris TaxID=2518645 RepID=A0A5C1QQL4_9SPIO|nr:IclR family transcriptional regulator [Oceanispirochaeta crateris]QEN09658.1 IclR family transcriptional regulator [Oceanispirochaeta crateris]